MNKSRLYIFGAFAFVALLLIPLFALSKEGNEGAAIGQVDERDKQGKELFVTNCGRCHSLYAAGSFGTVGPDLDDHSLADSPSFGGAYSTVLDAVQCGINGRMPRGILTGSQASEVSKFVAAYAGERSQGPAFNTETEEIPPDDGCPGEGDAADDSAATATEATPAP